VAVVERQGSFDVVRFGVVDDDLRFARYRGDGRGRADRQRDGGSRRGGGGGERSRRALRPGGGSVAVNF